MCNFSSVSIKCQLPYLNMNTIHQGIQLCLLLQPCFDAVGLAMCCICTK